MSRNFGSSEIILIAEAVAREKNISKEAVIEALEDAIKVAARRKYGHESSIRVDINRRTGEVQLFREFLVVDQAWLDEKAAEEERVRAEIEANDGEDPNRRERAKEKEKELNPVLLDEARIKYPEINLGDVISEPLPPIDLGRVAAQSAKQVITYKVKEIERARNYEEFKDRIGKIVSGVVEKVEFSGVVVKIGGAEAVIPNEYLMRDERKGIKNGERIRALVYEVNQELRGAQVVLSRTHNQFLSELFAQEVPEIYDKVIEIKAVARDPGSRAKIAVFSSDPSIDPVGSCVGVRGARVQAVINELNGEKIDVMPWSSDPATLVVSALAPAEVTKVIIDEDNKVIEVVVPDEQLSIAIGKRGQNIRLASKLVGWNIDVMTEEVESRRRNEEFTAITAKFISALDLEEILAQLLASEGYTSIQDIAEATLKEIADIEGLDEGIAEELISRAQEYSRTHEDAANTPVSVSAAISKLDSKLLQLIEKNEELALKLFNGKVLTLTDLADLASDEFMEQVPDSGLTEENINDLIMKARSQVYFNDK